MTARRAILDAEAEVWKSTGIHPTDELMDARQKGAQKWRSILTDEERDSMVKVMIDSHRETANLRKEEREQIREASIKEEEIKADPKYQKAVKEKWEEDMALLATIKATGKKDIESRLEK